MRFLRSLGKRPFYRYGGHIEFIGFKEYYGMPRGALHSVHLNTAQRSLFPLQSLSRKTSRKIGSKSALIHTERVYRIVFMPAGHPIILLKSNKFDKKVMPIPSFKTKCYQILVSKPFLRRHELENNIG